MSYCYHPLKAIDFGVADLETGKHSIKVVKGEYSADEVCKFPGAKFIPLPCGRCIGCRLKYSRDWADRCMLESTYYKNNIFLTLTYDDSHLPECLEGSPVHPLSKRDIQLFIKRLRKEFPDEHIRYFACGEYGSKSMRPHYHLLLFNINLTDLEFHHRDIKSNNLYYVSDTISRCWYPECERDLPSSKRSTNGFHLISDVTWETCAYTARYIMKKQKGRNSSIYDDYNFPPEFTLMSRKPGIGNNFYQDHNDIVVKPFYLPTKSGHREIKSNRYFDKLFDIDYPNDLEFIKEDRLKIAQKNEALKSNVTSLSYSERLAAEEANKIASTKILKRKEV